MTVLSLLQKMLKERRAPGLITRQKPDLEPPPLELPPDPKVQTPYDKPGALSSLDMPKIGRRAFLAGTGGALAHSVLSRPSQELIGALTGAPTKKLFDADQGVFNTFSRNLWERQSPGWSGMDRLNITPSLQYEVDHSAGYWNALDSAIKKLGANPIDIPPDELIKRAEGLHNPRERNALKDFLDEELDSMRFEAQGNKNLFKSIDELGPLSTPAKKGKPKSYYTSDDYVDIGGTEKRTIGRLKQNKAKQKKDIKYLSEDATDKELLDNYEAINRNIADDYDYEQKNIPGYDKLKTRMAQLKPVKDIRVMKRDIEGYWSNLKSEKDNIKREIKNFKKELMDPYHSLGTRPEDHSEFIRTFKFPKELQGKVNEFRDLRRQKYMEEPLSDRPEILESVKKLEQKIKILEKEINPQINRFLRTVDLPARAEKHFQEVLKRTQKAEDVMLGKIRKLELP
tara:strand:+ start:10692 stop:12056 length:1365 start_codon:yes stop_codon:yes gene_type:complete